MGFADISERKETASYWRERWALMRDENARLRAARDEAREALRIAWDDLNNAANFLQAVMESEYSGGRNCAFRRAAEGRDRAAAALKKLEDVR